MAFVSQTEINRRARRAAIRRLREAQARGRNVVLNANLDLVPSQAPAPRRASR